MTGPNGAGKTNILEALSFLAPGRGLRGTRLAEASRRAPGAAVAEGDQGGGWAVAARLSAADGETDIGTGYDGSVEKRQIRIDGETGPQSALAERVSLQWLTPQMDRLFQEGASSRRRFLDRLVFGRDSAHAGRVNAYDHATRERARLLKERGAGADPAWLDALEQTMAEKGVAIAAARLDMVARLSSQLDAAGDGPFPAADLAVEGDVEAWLVEGSALTAEDRLKGALRHGRAEDAASGRTGQGPHRSDLKAFHRTKGQAAELCSTGEQKALLVSVIFALARLQRRERGLAPILLLDEVAAHLDRARRDALFAEIEALGLQAWMTGTDEEIFRPLAGRASFFRVEDATVTPVPAAPAAP